MYFYIVLFWSICKGAGSWEPLTPSIPRAEVSHWSHWQHTHHSLRSKASMQAPNLRGIQTFNMGKNDAHGAETSGEKCESDERRLHPRWTCLFAHSTWR